MGFNRRSICTQVRYAAKFSRWLKGNRIAIGSLTDEHVEQFLRRFKGSVCCGVPAALRRLLVVVRQSGFVPEQGISPIQPTPIQELVCAYLQHLRKDQNLSLKTCVQYSPFIVRFLSERFANGAVDCGSLCGADVVQHVTCQAKLLSQSRGKSLTNALRSFLRYLRCRGDIDRDLAVTVPMVANWSMTGIPKAISADHVRAVLASCNRDTQVGCRDYAILMLLARLGLRSGEIVALKLDSIDWEVGGLTVAGKGGRIGLLPLPADVGQAIAAYLLHSRPRTSCRSLFMSAKAPIRGLGSATSVGSIVLSAIARAGVQTSSHGSHQFRHALACEMLRQGATLLEIGQILRHRHSKTTGIYAKVDFAALRPLSLAWPGEAQ